VYKNKHLRLDQEKIDKVKILLDVRTDTDAINQALQKVIEDASEHSRRKNIANQMERLRKRVGKIHEDTALWVRFAREERGKSE
jgi:tagatose-1,6-bisphosphate aldolase